MIFTAPADRLLKAVQATASLAPGTGKRFQIESTLLSVLDDGSLEIRATDLVDSYWFVLPATKDATFKPGRVFVGSENLARSIKAAGDQQVTLETGKHSLTISWGSTKIKLPTENADDAPEVARHRREDPAVVVAADAFVSAMTKVNFAVSQDFKSRALAFIRLDLLGSKMQMSATDGIRYAVVEQDVDGDVAGTAFVTPLKPTRIKLLTGETPSAKLRVQLGSGHVSFATDDAELTVRTGAVSWQSFDVKSLVQVTKKVVANTKELRALLNGAGLVKTSGEKNYDFGFADGAINMRATAAGEGSFEASVRVEWTYDAFEMRFDPALLAQAVAQCDSDTVELGMSTNQQPILLTSTGSDWCYRYALGARF